MFAVLFNFFLNVKAVLMANYRLEIESSVFWADGEAQESEATEMQHNIKPHSQQPEGRIRFLSAE